MNAASNSVPNSSRMSSHPVSRAALRLALAAAVATALVGFVMQAGPFRPARGRDDTTSVNAVNAHAAFVAEIQRTLKTDDLRLIALAKPILEEPGVPERFEEQLDRLRIDVMKAEGEHQYATQKRAIAELALEEFAEAVLPRDLAAADTQLSIAHAEMLRARAQSKDAKRDVEKIVSELDQQKALFAFEQAESNRDVLVKYTKSQRTKELGAQLAKARSEERSKKAEWQRLKDRLEKLKQVGPLEPGRTDVAKRILALIDRAVPIEERVQAGLLRFKGGPNPGDAAKKEIRTWTNELEAAIDEAEAIKAADDFARWKPRIEKAARHHSAARPR